MAIESVVTNPAERTLTFMGRWVWDHEALPDGDVIGERLCGHFTAYVISTRGQYSFLIWDERIEDEPIYESSYKVSSRRSACNLATRDLRYRSELDATHRLVPISGDLGLRQTT